MTPYQFGIKVAGELGIQPVPKAIPDIPKAPKAARPLAAVKQPMNQALESQAKMFPKMVTTARGSGQNPLKAFDAFSHAVRTRTGEHPSNWEMTGALMEPGGGFEQAQKQPPQ